MCVDFLLALTFALDMWEWQTWEVVQYLVKPSTEGKGRCRFMELAAVREYAGAASVFMSHCWGGRWGDLVAAACAGADANRVVWIDVFAVRQWPGGLLVGWRAVARRLRLQSTRERTSAPRTRRGSRVRACPTLLLLLASGCAISA